MTASRQKLWVASDQIASSATNFGSAALLAGLLTSEGFGAVSVSFAVYVIVAGLSRAWSGEPLILLGSAAKANDQQDVIARALGASFVIGGGLGVLVIVGGLLLGSTTGVSLVALGGCLAGLLAHDTGRIALITRNSARHAFESDLIWLALAFVALIVLRRLDHQSVFLGTLAWALPGVVAACWALYRLRLLPRFQASWIASSRHVGVPTTYEFAIMQASSSMALLLVTAYTADLAFAGAFRGAQVILGPTAVCVAAVSLYMRPLMVRASENGVPLFPLTIRFTVACLVGFAICTATALVTPRAIGTRLFGTTWDGARDLVPIVSMIFLALALTAGPLDAIRSLGRFGVIVRARSVISAIVLASTYFGARAISERGAITGFGVGSLVGALIAWAAFVSQTRHKSGAEFDTGAERRSASVSPNVDERPTDDGPAM